MFYKYEEVLNRTYFSLKTGVALYEKDCGGKSIIFCNLRHMQEFLVLICVLASVYWLYRHFSGKLRAKKSHEGGCDNCK